MKKGVSIKNMTKIFVTNKNTKVRAVDNVNLEIEAGEFVTLLGPSGCGKTTLLRMVAGFETLTEGDIYIGKENVKKMTPDKRDTALVFQNYALFPHMNVYENIAYGLKLQDIPKSEVKKRVERILDLMKMEGFSDRVPSEMSGGQQQRVSLARALVMEPGVLLFDEPLSNLDAKLRIHMRDEIRKIQQKVGITSIYVTHDQSEAMGLSDKVVILKDGLIQQVGSPKEIYQKPTNAFVASFIGRANIINGVIVKVEENDYTVDIKGKRFNVKSLNTYNLKDAVKLVIRPESIIVDDDSYKTIVEKSLFMGQNHEYEVLWGDEILQISDSNPYGRKTYELGEKMSIGFDESALHLL